MIDLSEVRSLTDFKRHAAEFVERLKQTGRPQVLTVNGRAAVVIQDAGAYQKLLDAVERAEAIEGIRRGLDSVARGEDCTLEEVSAELRAKYGLPRDA